MRVNETVRYWRDLARAYVYNISPEDAEALAERCAAAVQAGHETSLWHQSALLFGHHCNCAICNPTAPKGRFTYKSVAA